jgi:Prolipoprotein diacylglyceryl transferase
VPRADDATRGSPADASTPGVERSTAGWELRGTRATPEGHRIARDGAELLRGDGARRERRSHDSRTWHPACNGERRTGTARHCVDEITLQLLALFGAFWAAVLGFAAELPRSRWAWRAIAGLGLGGVFTHLGWALLNLPVLMAQPGALLNPSIGYTVLALPLGPLATAPWRERVTSRDAYLSAVFRNLPLALAVARMGCLAAGCCYGTPTRLPWGVRLGGEPPAVHPTPVYEIALLVALWLGLRRLPRAWVAPVFLMAFGAIRLVLEPLRAAPPLGPPLVPAAVVAAFWTPAGLLLAPRSALARLWRRRTEARRVAS